MRTRNRRTCVAIRKPSFIVLSLPRRRSSKERAANDVQDDVAEVVQHLGEDPEDGGYGDDDEAREDHVLGHRLTAVPSPGAPLPIASHDLSVRERRSRAQARSAPLLRSERSY